MFITTVKTHNRLLLMERVPWLMWATCKIGLMSNFDQSRWNEIEHDTQYLFDSTGDYKNREMPIIVSPAIRSFVKVIANWSRKYSYNPGQTLTITRLKCPPLCVSHWFIWNAVNKYPQLSLHENKTLLGSSFGAKCFHENNYIIWRELPWKVFHALCIHFSESGFKMYFLFALYIRQDSKVYCITYIKSTRTFLWFVK